MTCFVTTLSAAPSAHSPLSRFPSLSFSFPSHFLFFNFPHTSRYTCSPCRKILSSIPTNISLPYLAVPVLLIPSIRPSIPHYSIISPSCPSATFLCFSKFVPRCLLCVRGYLSDRLFFRLPSLLLHHAKLISIT